jgi:cysteine-rich repeat protein
MCTDEQVQQLRFIDVHEAQTDVIRFCRALETAAVSAVFLPLPAAPAELSAAERACVAATARSTSKLLGTAFRSRQRVLDRIAQRSFTLSQKRRLVDDSAARIAEATVQLSDGQLETCPEAAFSALYGRESTAFLATIATRADCLGGDAYAQAGIVCPAPACGNGMREPGEDCDDGNQLDGDACPATCVRG